MSNERMRLLQHFCFISYVGPFLQLNSVSVAGNAFMDNRKMKVQDYRLHSNKISFEKVEFRLGFGPQTLVSNL